MARRTLGPVLHLPGLRMTACRLDAHRPAASTRSTSSPKPSSHKDWPARSIVTVRTACRPIAVSVVTNSDRPLSLPGGGSMAIAHLSHRLPDPPRPDRGAPTADGHWIAIALMNTPIEALQQSFGLRTKARNRLRRVHARFGAQGQQLEQYRLQADAERARSPTCACSSCPAARRPLRLHPAGGRQRPGDRLVQGLHAARRRCRMCSISPNGWVFNSNDWLYSAAGPDSPKRADFPRYMDTAR